MLTAARYLPAHVDDATALKVGGKIRVGWLRFCDCVAEIEQLRAAVTQVEIPPRSGEPKESVALGWVRSSIVYEGWPYPAGSEIRIGRYGSAELGSVRFYLLLSRACPDRASWWLPTTSERLSRSTTSSSARSSRADSSRPAKRRSPLADRLPRRRPGRTDAGHRRTVAAAGTPIDAMLDDLEAPRPRTGAGERHSSTTRERGGRVAGPPFPAMPCRGSD